MKATKFPLKSALKIGCGNFKFHPIRLIATILVAVISFSCLSVSLHIAVADTIQSYAKTMYENLSYTQILKSEFFKLDIDDQSLDQFLGVKNIHHHEMTMNDSDIEQFESLSKTPVIKLDIYDSKIFSYQFLTAESLDRLQDLANHDDRCFGTEAEGFVVVDQNLIDTYGFRYVGKLPQNENEIAINDCILNLFCEFGFTENEEVFKIQSAEDILGHKIPIERDLLSSTPYYTITAVIDTGCGKNCSHRQQLDAFHTSSDRSFFGPLYTDISDFFHDRIFVHDDFLKEYDVVLLPITTDYDDFLAFTRNMVEALATARENCEDHPQCYTFYNRYSPKYDLYCSEANMIRIASLYLSGIFFVISLLLLTNFIATLIRGQMKEIGILSSMGAGFRKTLFIYFLGALVPCLAVFLLSLIGTIGGIVGYNAWMGSQYGLIFNLVSLNPLFLLVLLALSALTAFLGSILPLLKMRKMSSAEIIRRGQIK